MIIPERLIVGTLIGTLVTVPAGGAGVVLSVTGTNTVYIGNGTSLSTTNGYPVVGGAAPTYIPGIPGSSQTVLYAMASAASTPVGVILTTAA